MSSPSLALNQNKRPPPRSSDEGLNPSRRKRRQISHNGGLELSYESRSFFSTKQPLPSPKPNNNNIGTATTTTNSNSTGRNVSFHGVNSVPNSCYEPTSVLDLRRSPSPVPEKSICNLVDVSDCIVVSDPPPHHRYTPLEWDEHVLRNMDWDSIMKDLGLDDESVPFIKTIPPQAITPSCENHIQNLPEFTSCEFTHHSEFNNLYYFYSGLNQNPSHQSNFPGGTNNLVMSTSSGFHNIGNSNLGFDFIKELVRAADCFC
ncbi:hypothetical protein F3Y22_tig00110377pilonHSYRG00256 [Hibiscus syriacus]|uniref:Uncharacterized protein n=1 Tax=Hibiscus syriacus TaxID=106335 RepID=A0A6A3ASS6_HIBSY|nr:hypothetical protein F3Y22_tig00110377pilonHSYRG00256 [Hibiscus syriacus]